MRQALSSRRPELSKFIMEGERAMFNRSEIMKRSWQLRRQDYPASDALEMAWAEAKHKRIVAEKKRRDQRAKWKREAMDTLFATVIGSQRVHERLDRVKVA